MKRYGLVVITALIVSAIHIQAETLFQPDMSTWYAFEPRGLTDDFALGLKTWNRERAGAKGRIRMADDRLIVDGEPIKLWGLNNEYADCMPPKKVADFRAAFYARQGFNSLRQHKFNDTYGWGGYGSVKSVVEFDKERLDRFDYFNARLMEHGLYLDLSSNFGVKYGPADAHRFEAHEDFAKGDEPFKSNHRIATGHGAIFLSPGLQELHIEQLTNLLRHKNPYTGKTYAEDPGVAFVEIFNEDAVLFYSTSGQLQKSPIMRRYAAKRFAAWLKNKYVSEQKWRAVWGAGNIIASVDPEEVSNKHLHSFIAPDTLKGELPPESFANGIVPWGHPWFWDTTTKRHDDAGLNALRQRLLDTMEFLISLQDEFYKKAVAAIRATGYTGEIIGSNWQAGSMTGHFWNLYSDSKVGLIDRHNYYGGGWGGLRLKDGLKGVNQISQLDYPGSELLSSGLQQVGDRPFMFSEWNVVQPTEWYAEGPAIIGSYGMGLQGWDASYIFASYQDAGFAPNLDDVKKFSIDTPPIMGVMPAVSRMVRRGDIQESERLAIRHVSLENLRTGNFDFQDFMKQNHDLKSLDGDIIPKETLAAARTVIAFNSDGKTEPYDFGNRAEADGISASSGQLFWSETEGDHNDYFTVNTLGTKAFIGFAEKGDTAELGEVSIVPEPGFLTMYLTAAAPDKTLQNDAAAIMAAMGRARNTGMDFSADGKILNKVGRGPILLEPVRAAVHFGRRPVKTVYLLDHDGRETGKTLPVVENTVQIDTGRDRTPYYRVIYGK